jgi:hypothetical protein
MHPPKDLSEIVRGKRYSVKTAVLLAGDDFFDGGNFERRGRNTFLYRTPKGNYFSVSLTQWQGERTTLQPLSQDEALTLYESLSEKRIEAEEAFPGVKIEEA